MLELVDLFCGAGGMTLGLRQAGIEPRLGIDSDEACVSTYARNFKGARTLVSDIHEVTDKLILSSVSSRENLVMSGCPPCRLFSRLHRHDLPAGREIARYLFLVDKVRPAYLVFENVPQICKYESIWDDILATLDKCQYKASHKIVLASDYGVPQHRERLLLVAASTEVRIPDPARKYAPTVRKAIGHLPESDSSIPNHVSMRPSPENLDRLRRTPNDGGKSRVTGCSFSDSYARMHWERPSPTITTKCISFSNGRFGHPEYDRAITVREAAYLQGFPPSFRFVGNLAQTAAQVGNAVPPPLAKVLGLAVVRHSQANATVTGRLLKA